MGVHLPQTLPGYPLPVQPLNQSPPHQYCTTERVIGQEKSRLQGLQQKKEREEQRRERRFAKTATAADLADAELNAVLKETIKVRAWVTSCC